MDPVNKDAVKKKFADRKDKDIDNDGDVDSSDKFLHKRRAAISKAMKEDLGKEDEPKVKKIIGKLKKPEPNVKLERKTYFENKPGSLGDVAAKVVSEAMDPVNKDAVKKKFADRKDKDIDNDGDVDSSDKFLHKRRAAISKAMKEDLGKEDEPKVKKIIGKLKKASDAHAGQAPKIVTGKLI